MKGHKSILLLIIGAIVGWIIWLITKSWRQ